MANKNGLDIQNRSYALVAGLICGIMASFVYFVVTPQSFLWQKIAFGVIAFLATSVIIYRYLTIRVQRSADSWQKKLPAVKEHDHLGRRLKRFRHKTTAGDKRIEFSEGAPLVQGMIECGISLQALALSAWGFSGFAGYQYLAIQLTNKKIWWAWAFVLIVIGIFMFIWGRSSLREKPIVAEDPKLQLLVVGALVASWGAFLFPGGPELVHYVKEDTFHVFMVPLVISGIWACLRFASYRGFAYLLTDKNLSVGRVAYFTEDDPDSTIPIVQITNVTWSRGTAGTFFNYSILTCKVPGDENQVFAKLRVRHGYELKEILNVLLSEAANDNAEPEPSDKDDAGDTSPHQPTGTQQDPISVQQPMQFPQPDSN